MYIKDFVPFAPRYASRAFSASHGEIHATRLLHLSARKRDRAGASEVNCIADAICAAPTWPKRSLSLSRSLPLRRNLGDKSEFDEEIVRSITIALDRINDSYIDNYIICMPAAILYFLSDDEYWQNSALIWFSRAGHDEKGAWLNSNLQIADLVYRVAVARDS